MKLSRSLALCMLLCLSLASAQTTEENKHKTTSKVTTVVPTMSTSQPTKPSSTTSEPTTPSTTPQPTTPSSTTPQPTTPSSTTPQTSTSTVAPTTASTSAAPPTSPSTTAAPSNKEWLVEDPSTHHACIMATMDVNINLHTPNVSNEMKIDPATARAEGGSCKMVIGNETSQMLRLVWQNNSMDIVFSKKDKSYFISALNLSLAYNTSSGMQVATFSSQNLNLFGTSVNSSYACDSAEFPELKNNNTEHVDIKVTHLQLEAFRTMNSTSFSASHYCPGEVPDVVPLVVGVCLAGLVLVVVVAYLIGRRRSQASGYHSM